MHRRFKEAGVVASFRMAGPDKDGKPRGYAFCEYVNIDSATNAIRMLNGKDFNGRAIRVDYADQGTSGGSSGSSGSDTNISDNRERPTSNFVSIEQMREIISRIPKLQLYEAISSMKNLLLSDPEQAKLILKQNPVLRFAIVHAQYCLGMEKTLFGERQNIYKPPIRGAPFQQNPSPYGMPQQFQPVQQYPQATQQNQALSQLMKTISPQQLKEILAITPEQLKTLPEQTQQQVLMIQTSVAQLTKQ